MLKQLLENQLRSLRSGLDVPVDQIDLTQVMPIFVPSGFFAHGKWVGPYCRLRNPEIGMTWTVLMPGRSIRYVDRRMTDLWEGQKVDWKTLAKRNLSNITTNQPGVKEMRSAAGDLCSIAFMFEDGLGPSRLIFREGLAQRFPAGYRVAMPEMSCGLAYAKDLQGPDLATVTGLIDHCHRSGTRPFVPGSYDPDDLLTVEEVG
jgi:hypothetical protein